MSVKTRQEINCPVFGAPKNFDSNMLPTYKSVMQCYNFIMQQLRDEGSGKQPSLKETTGILTGSIKELWNKASIPSVSDERVTKMFRDYHEKYRNIVKSMNKPSMTDVFKTKLSDFQEYAEKTLFDITTCKCVDLTICTCERLRKVPERERAFLNDQRTDRKMYMSGIDIHTSLILERKEKRKNKGTGKNSDICVASTSNEIHNLSSSSNQSSDCEVDKVDDNLDNETDSDFPLPQTVGRKRKRNQKSNAQQMRVSLPSLAEACDRTGVSNRAAAIIASAVLEDMKIITKADFSKVIDKSKVHRERKKNRTEMQSKEKEQVKKLEGLYFDGRKDVTIALDTTKGKNTRKTIKEEHVVLVQEPLSNYLGHITPESGSGHSIQSSIISYLNSNKIETSDLVAIGCDGTAVNTGSSNGVIALFELAINKPVQWLICQIHANELPLRHLIQTLDGPTSGPNGFSGPIGKQIQTCETLQVIKFASVNVTLPDIDSQILSSDQKYLLDICTAVSTGYCPSNLARMNPGKLNHARWLTTASRILRYYVGCTEPSDNLRHIVDFIMKVYCKMWFTIRANPVCTEGARHLWQTINLSRYVSDELKAIIDPVINRNAFFAHPENIILAMISDTRSDVRKLGLRRILKARGIRPSNIRQFAVPKINFDATDYIDMIDWQKCQLTEPPITACISDDKLKEMITTGELTEIKKFPCHTQAVERCIKLVTEASSKVCGAQSRDGFIRARLASRAIIPSFNTKNQYQAHSN